MTKSQILDLLKQYATIPNQSKTKKFIPEDSFPELAGKILALKKEKKGVFIPPSMEEVKLFFFENGYDPNKGIEVYKYYAEANPPWTDRNGNQVRSWKSKIRANWFRPEFRVDTNVQNNMKGMVL